MSGRRVETPYYTEAQVREHVAAALAVLEGFDLEPDEHPALLVAVFDKLAAKNIAIEQANLLPPGMAIPRGI